MKFFKKRFSRFIGLSLSFALALSTFVPVYAAEGDSSTTILDESQDMPDISFEDAVEYLGLTPEEAQQVQLYVVESDGDVLNLSQGGIQPLSEVTDPSRTYINSGEIFNPGYFSFTGRNVGRYRTMNGTKLKLSFVWKPISTDTLCEVYIQLHRYGVSQDVAHMWLHNDVEHPENYNVWQGNWIDIVSGRDYNLIYDAEDFDHTMDVRVSMCTIIAVY